MRGTLFPNRQGIAGNRFIPAYAGNAIAFADGDCIHPVHPRVCGERVPAASSMAAPSGSSPRMRGTRGIRMLRNFRRRFIPAYAGNARNFSLKARRSSVHPRVCGERSKESLLSIPTNGSSPRMRGTLRRQPFGILQSRFIPAYAGNADSPRLATCLKTVHPRVCGERPYHWCFSFF